MTIGEAFSAALAWERKDADLTQAALATRAGLTADYVSKLEGGRKAPSLEVIGHLANAMGIGDEPWRLLYVEPPRKTRKKRRKP